MNNTLADVTETDQASQKITLDWVGMDEIDLPISILQDDSLPETVAKIKAEVSLDDKDAKGIHMSRLYRFVSSLAHKSLVPADLSDILQQFLESHDDLSANARIKIEADVLINRPALLSDNKGWKAYAVALLATQEGESLPTMELQVSIPYSSTCPMSAALSRQLIQKAALNYLDQQETFDQQTFLKWLGSTDAIVATPHSQRSEALIRIKIAPDTKQFPLLELINLIENTLKTAVQTAVKREDEQEFARLNGQNLMFCEDSARKVSAELEEIQWIEDYRIKISHFESLHAHNAVAENTKGIPGGYRAQW